MDVLFDAAKALSSDKGRRSLLEIFPLNPQGDTEFNEAVMVFIPKKVARDRNGVRFHKPAETRPLSLVNTDNRWMANAHRHRVEPLTAPAICGPRPALASTSPPAYNVYIASVLSFLLQLERLPPSWPIADAAYGPGATLAVLVSSAAPARWLGPSSGWWPSPSLSDVVPILAR